MKKLLPVSLVAIMGLLLTFSGTYAQKSADKNIYYKFIQLPSHPLTIKKYDYIVFQNGESAESEDDQELDYESLKRAYATDIKYYYERLSEIDRQLYEIGKSEELSLLKKQIKMGEVHNQEPAKPSHVKLTYEDQMEFYVTEMKQHDARIDSLNNSDIKMLFKAQLRSLMNETKPTRPYLRTKSATSGPYLIPDAIISEKMDIRGLERVYDDPEKIFFEISLSEFETKEEKKKSMNKEVFIFEYRRIAGFKVFDENNKLIDEGLIPTTDEWISNKYDLSSNKVNDIKKKIKEFEKSSAESSLRTTKNFLALKYGSPIESRSSELSYAKGKNFNYETITEAYEIAQNILNNFLTKENPDVSGLKKAIGIWEQELKEADYSNKKARISHDVALGLSFNIIECSIWLNDFDKAQNILDELSKLDSKSKTERKINYYRDFMQDRKERYEANNDMLAKN
ncbi:MAG: hypothetical protein ACERIH_10090 [Labilibaculum antarcticum]